MRYYQHKNGTITELPDDVASIDGVNNHSWTLDANYIEIPEPEKIKIAEYIEYGYKGYVYKVNNILCKYINKGDLYQLQSYTQVYTPISQKEYEELLNLWKEYSLESENMHEVVVLF